MAAGRERPVEGVRVPTFLYGTAWKEERTRELVVEALDAGYRGIDTANQRRHYYEDDVGRALSRAREGGGPDLDELFIQTKFTHPAGQGDQPPYDPDAAPADQVRQSVRSSMEHLGLDRLDSYLLHAPSQRPGLGETDREAWRAMEEMQQAGRTLLLGVSNVLPDQLRELCEFARVQPAFVQNRCRARLSWDAAVREVCSEQEIVYQAFSLLTANQRVLEHPVVREIAARHGRSVPQVIFRFALALGMIPLTGTTDPEHMRQDLAVYEFDLDEDEVEAIEQLGAA